MHAFADGHRPRCIGLGALAGGIEAVGVDGQRPQLHRGAIVSRDQHIAAIALALGLQPAAAEQAQQAFLNAVAAVEPRGGEMAGLLGVERNGHPRLHAELGDGVAQGPAAMW